MPAADAVLKVLPEGQSVLAAGFLQAGEGDPTIAFRARAARRSCLRGQSGKDICREAPRARARARPTNGSGRCFARSIRARWTTLPPRAA